MRTKFLSHVSGQVNFNIVGKSSSANRTFASYSFAQNIAARDADHVTAWLYIDKRNIKIFKRAFGKETVRCPFDWVRRVVIHNKFPI